MCFSVLGCVTPWSEMGHTLAYSILGVLGGALLTDKIRDWCLLADFRDFDKLKTQGEDILREINRYYDLNEKSVLEENWVTQKEKKISLLQTGADCWERVGRVVFYVLSLFSVCILCNFILYELDRSMGPWVVLFTAPIFVIKIYFLIVYHIYKSRYNSLINELQDKKVKLDAQNVEKVKDQHLADNISAYLQEIGMPEAGTLKIRHDSSSPRRKRQSAPASRNRRNKPHRDKREGQVT